jgi:diguanylate cyclase (GGDEF)-like protein
MKFKLSCWKLNILGGTLVRGRAEQQHRIHAAREVRFGQISTFNALHGLANCPVLSETVESEIKRSNRSERDFAVLVFEVNEMKQISDRNGRLAVNRALCRLARIFRSSCRSIDTAARYSDDKFAVILPMSGSEAADIVERRICERLSTDREEPRLSVSAGIAVYPQDGKTRDTLFQAAGRALYNGKRRAGEAHETVYSN